MARDIEYGYEIPTKDDDGDQWGQVIEDFMDRMATHSHNGDDSSTLSTTINKNVQIYDASAWATDANETVKDYRYVDIISYPSTTSATNHTRDFVLFKGTYTPSTAQDDAILLTADERYIINPTIEWSGNNMRIKIMSELAADNLTGMHLLVMTY